MQLRPHQSAMLDAAREALRRHRRIMLVGSTGIGKTVLALEMIRGAVAREVPVLFLCHRRELVRQSSRAFWQANVQHGQIMAGKAMTDTLANVGVINTVVNRLDRIREPGLIIIDEAHRSVSPSYLEVLERWPNARVVGLTATPERTDGKGLGYIYDEIVEGPPMQWLIENGYLADYRIIAPSGRPDLSGVRTRAGDYATDDLEKAIDKPTITGDAVAAYQRLAHGRRCMVFCVTIEHSKHVCEQYVAAGVPAEHVDGNHSDAERDAILGRFRRGETLVVCSVHLAIEGLDIAAIEVVQFLRPTQSLIVYLQAIGRGLRVEAGKDELLILDQVANWERHGLPDDARRWSLEGRQKGKRKKQDQEGDVTVKQCAKCYAVFRIGPDRCPQCGEPVPGGGREPPKVVDGHLVEIEKAKARREARREQGNARTLRDLVLLGQRRGMRNPEGWACNVFAAREGRRPTPSEFNEAKQIAAGG